MTEHKGNKYMATVTPLSVQFTDKIHTDPRERQSTNVKEVREAEKICSKLQEAASLQASLGLGNPKASVENKRTEYSRMGVLAEAERLAEKFQPVKEPNAKFFPRFAVESGARYIPNMASGSAKGRLPELVLVKLQTGVEKVYCRLEAATGSTKSYYEAPIPVMPLTALELAKRAKECAPSAEFHLAFLPQWEAAPLRDPVLFAYLKGTDEWFTIAQWDGDVALINEFLED